MTEFIELGLQDGTAVRLRVFPTGTAAERSGGGPDRRRPPDLDGGEAVSSGAGRRAAALAQGALRTALRPLVPLLQEVHDTVAAVPSRPQEVSVEFGVQFGSDLSIGIVGGTAESSLTVSATWQLPATGPARTSGT
ncbi:CU044_2847 family protein [Kitasatospora purpeofusca]|uniref:CU044_2847 family protein n=1 Tax=Kitasatospora purpeofusca TaxID=67352 RepID=UPI003650D917